MIREYILVYKFDETSFRENGVISFRKTKSTLGTVILSDPKNLIF